MEDFIKAAVENNLDFATPGLGQQFGSHSEDKVQWWQKY